MIEQLETRRMLAGNVNAVINGSGELVITGDNKANQIQVIAGIADTAVVGVNGTTVNHGVPFDVGGFPNVKASMGNGDDTVELIDFLQSATVVTGNGNDKVLCEDDFFGQQFGDLTIDTGNGNDIVSLGGAKVDGNLNINTGNGNDSIEVTFVEVAGNMNINGGKGYDTLINVLFANVGGTPTVVGIENSIVVP